MISKEKNQRYSYEKIEEIFLNYRENDGNEEWDITDSEYKIICEVLQYVPKKEIDQIIKDVYFVVLSMSKKGKIQTGCYLSLDSKDIKNKKGIIFFSPQIFMIKSDILFPTKQVLHEIAHHIKGHKDPRDSVERKKFEDEADELAIKWLSGKQDVP